MKVTGTVSKTSVRIASAINCLEISSAPRPTFIENHIQIITMLFTCLTIIIKEIIYNLTHTSSENLRLEGELQELELMTIAQHYDNDMSMYVHSSSNKNIAI